MGLLSNLLKIGGVVGAPFTAGASLLATGAGGLLNKAGGAAGAAGSVLAGQQGGANNARVQQGNLDLGADRNAVDLYQAQQNAQDHAAQTDLDRQKFGLTSRNTNAKDALISALIGGGLQPTAISHGVASGGLLRSLNANPDALAAMQALHGQASTAQGTPLQFQGGQMIAAPTMTQMPKIDVGNGALGTTSKLLQIFGAIAPFLKKSQDNSDEDAN